LINELCVRFGAKYGKEPTHLVIDSNLWHEWTAVPLEHLNGFGDMHIRMRMRKSKASRQICVSDGTNYECGRLKVSLI
jgi:hypothetical protein